MQTQWQPNLEHPAATVPVTQEARGLFAAGWHAGADEGRIVNLATQMQQIVSTETWHAMRELSASVPAQLTY
jgi:hypothetical protein